LYLQAPVLHDTGSDMQSLYWIDLQALNFDAVTYTVCGGMILPVEVLTANGTTRKYSIQLQMKVVDVESKSLTDWFWITALIQDLYPGCPMLRLSGSEMRQHLFFATERGKTRLFIAKNKTGLHSILPST